MSIIMVYILVILLIAQLFIIYYAEGRNYLSVSFFATAFFLISAVFYFIGMGLFQSDLLVKTVFLIYGSLVVLTLGELIGQKTRFKVLSCNTEKLYIVKHRDISMITVIMVMIFIYRFLDLYLYSLEIGNTGGIFHTISVTRLDYAMGVYKTSLPFYFLFTVGTLMSEMIAYFFIYIFMNNLVIGKRKELKLLLPVGGYAVILIALTERTSYIKLFTAFVIAYMLTLYKKQGAVRRRRLNKKIKRTVAGFGIMFGVFFFGYGIFTRGDKDGLSLFELLIAYIGAPLYGLNKMFEHPLPSYSLFGYYTMSGVYRVLNIFGFDFRISQTHLPMFEYGHLLTSNIYTSLALPLMDYGVTITILSRFFWGFLGGVIQKRMITSALINVWDFVLFILMVLLFYCGLMAFCADRYKEIFLSPTTLIKYTIFAWLTIKFTVRYKVIEIKRGGEEA